MSDRQERMYELEYPSPEVSDISDTTTLVVALQGYADAGHAVDASSSHLLAALDSRIIASFNTDELVDYRSRRPAVTIDHNEVTEMDELQLGLHVVKDSDEKPFLLLSGPEPDLRWGAFSNAVADLVEKFGVDQTICLYAAPMAVPHTRPMVVSAHGNSPDLVASQFSLDARVTVPGSAALQLERLLNKQGRNVGGYTVHVPHYVAASPYPAAALKLLESVADTAGLNLPLLSLERDAERVARQLAEQTGDSTEIQTVVLALEQQYDEELERYQKKHPQAVLPGEELPSGEEIGAEFEKFLATLDDDHGDNPEPTDDPSGDA